MLLTWFHKDHDFYTLKQIEKEGSKASKIPGMQIKDILNELIDDGLLNCEKCGNTNLYWSFKFDVIKQQNTRYNRLQNELANLQAQCERLAEDIDQEQKLRLPQVDGISRQHLLTKYDECVKLHQELSVANVNAKIKPQLQSLVCGIDTYTDAIESIISYLKSSGVDEKTIREEFEIPEVFEEIAFEN